MTTPVRDLESHYEHLLTCPEMIDTRDHLPLFRSLTGRILEIGCDVGNSTTAFLVGESRSVASIDINHRCGENFFGVEKWRFIAGDSQQQSTFAQVAEERFDALYIDGAHDYASVYHDLTVYSALVKYRGVILIHDVLAHDNFPGVWKAFREFRYPQVLNKYILPGSYGLGVIEL
jgi:predicted O-methyltransferase YrrM